MTILRVSELIECKHMTSILACLYMRGSMGKSEIYDTISNSPNMALKLRILSDEGLVESNQVGRRTEYSLTEKGSSVAEKLCGLEELVYGRVGDLNHLEEGIIRLDEDVPDETRDWFEDRRRGCCPLRSLVAPVVGDVVRLALEPLEGTGQLEPDVRLDVEDALQAGREGLGHLGQLVHVLGEVLLVELDPDGHGVHVVGVLQGDVVERGEERQLADDALDLGREDVDTADHEHVRGPRACRRSCLRSWRASGGSCRRRTSPM